MISIIVAFGMLFIFLIFGLLLFKVLRITIDTSFVIVPVIGALGIACLAQLFGLFLSMKVFAWVFSGAFLILCAIVRREVIQWLKEIWKHKIFLAIVFVSLCILAYPMLRENDLISVQKENEDIIFYLSSMDWLSGHTIFDKVSFSPEMPYYSAASYMLTETRFGFDILGALLKSVFNLQAHEIFLNYSVVLTVLGNFAVYELCLNSLKMDRKWALTALGVVAAGGNWVVLILWQYAPQIFGVTSLLAFTGCAFRLCREELKGYVFLTGLTLISTLCVYAEFAIYLLVIYLAILVPPLVARGDDFNKKKNSLSMVKAGLLGFVLNPVALYIAVKFNLRVFMMVVNTTGTAIDSAGRDCFTLQQIGSMVFGFNNHSESTSLAFRMLGIAAVLLLVIFMFSALFLLIKKRTTRVVSTLIITGFFIVYGMLFFIMGTEYPLFKHIITVSPFMVALLFYYISLSVNYIPIQRVANFLGLACGVCLVILNVHFVYSEYTSPYIMTYDDKKIQVSEIQDINTNGQAITIPENFSMHDNHLFAYALQNKPIRFMSDKSYFSYFIPDGNKEISDYILINSGDYQTGRFDIFTGLNIEKIWDNGTFCLIHADLNLQPQVLSGFYEFESYTGSSFRWTGDNESVISILNLTDEDKRFRVSLLTGDAPDGVKKNVQVVVGGRVIGEGLSATEINTKDISIKGKEEVNIIIQTSEPLSAIDNGDPRLFGISVISFQVIEQ